MVIEKLHAAELLETCRDYLEAHEAEHNLALGILMSLTSAHGDKPGDDSAPTPTLFRLSKDSQTIGVAIRTPPHFLVVSRIDGDVESTMSSLATRIGATGETLPGVIGPVNATKAFADAWVSAGYADTHKIGMRQGVFELTSVNELEAAPGTPRPARMEDCDLLTDWSLEFARLIESPHDAEEISRRVANHIHTQKLHVWDHDGPVSMASSVRPTRRGITINGVYTPKELRNHGYATSCVHALSALLLERGSEFCALYTDLSNPTSNAIYQRIGYRRIAESRVYRFDA